MTARSSYCSVLAKFFPMLVERRYFGGVNNPKTYFNHELGSNFFLSGLAYKLVNVFSFEEKIMLNKQKLKYLKKYWPGTQLYLWIWSLLYRECSPQIKPHVSHTIFQVAPVTCHMSHVTCHMSPVKCNFFSSLPNLPHFGGQNSECLEEHWWKFSQKKISFLNASFTTKHQ